MARLTLIQFVSGEYGLEEVDDAEVVVRLYDHTARVLLLLDIPDHGYHRVRTLADEYSLDDPGDFWLAIDGVEEIEPPDDAPDMQQT